MLVVFEDIHWAQTSEIELLEYLAQHVRDSPVRLRRRAARAARRAPAWGSGLVAQTTIPLEPLAAEDAAALAAALVADATPDDVVAGSSRSPRATRSSSRSSRPRSLELGPAAASCRSPCGEAIAARIDAMPPKPARALLSAAVVGKTFWRGVVEAVGGDATVDEALDELEARDFVRREPTSQLAGDAQFTFKHMLIREVAYATVPRASTPRAACRRRAHVEERRRPTETLATILAHHWREAGEPRRAIPYLLAAADGRRAQLGERDAHRPLLDGARARRRRARARRSGCGAGSRSSSSTRTTRRRRRARALLPELEGRSGSTR